MSKKHTINASKIERNWQYSNEPRLEGLLKQLKYIKWKNVETFKEEK